MKIFKSDLFGNILEPENILELVDIVTFNKDDNQVVHMWRGQSDATWRLDHSAYRRLRLTKKKITELDLISYEQNLLGQATHRGYRLQNGRKLSDFELLAKLQHHGAATRLLDFTRNAMVALWFSITNDSDKYGLLIGLNTRYLGGYESTDENAEYGLEIQAIKKYLHPQTWEPPVITPRIAAQHSQFIYSALSTDKRGSIHLDNAPDANLFIAISPAMKIKFGPVLEKVLDLRQHTLFPDIDGFGNSNGHSIPTDKMWRW